MAQLSSNPYSGDLADNPQELNNVLSLVPKSRYVLTAAYGEERGGTKVSFVQRCGEKPPMVCVAIEKGQVISPVIRDAHCFGLCQIPQDSTFLWRAFSEDHDAVTRIADPFDALQTFKLKTGAPLFSRAFAVLDCEVVMHLDIESDHEMFIAKVVAGRVLQPESRPFVRMHDDGKSL